MKFPFGKYKNLDTSDPEVPTHYLKWFEETMGSEHSSKLISAAFRNDLNAEISRREGDRPGAGKIVPKDRRIL